MCVPVIQVKSVDEARSAVEIHWKEVDATNATNRKSDGLMKFPITARVI